MTGTLHRLLEESARRDPDGVAVIDGERIITYGELESSSNRLAHCLVGGGVSRGDRVGVYLDKSIEAVIALYGVMKAGAAYVPLDPDSPPARLGTILANCAVRHLVTASKLREHWPALQAAGARLDMLVLLNPPGTEPSVGDERAVGFEVAEQAKLDAQPAHPPRIAVTPSDLAYILYTSGSTGVPKGVMLSHRNGLSFVTWAARTFDVQASDRLSNHAPFHFDLSTFDLFAAAWAGAAVVLVPRTAAVFPRLMIELVEKAGITIWYSVPSTLTLLAARGNLRPGDLPTLRAVLFAGEVLPPSTLRRLTAALPHTRFCNLYGPTETNVCLWYEVPRTTEPGLPADQPLPIGRPIDGVRVAVLTADGSAAGPGEVGELLVSGETVTRGYWGDAERSAAALVPCALGEDDVVTAYRTGDLVSLDAEGLYHFVGRRDSQVKSRGYRIELEEVERAFTAHPQVDECAVVAVPDELLTNRLKAFVVARGITGRDDLVSFCSLRIPAYMIPSDIELVRSLPRTSTGKIDRRALG